MMCLITGHIAAMQHYYCVAALRTACSLPNIALWDGTLAPVKRIAASSDVIALARPLSVTEPNSACGHRCQTQGGAVQRFWGALVALRHRDILVVAMCADHDD